MKFDSCVFNLFKRVSAVAVLTVLTGTVPQVSAGEQTAERIAALKAMASALRYSAELVNSKRVLAGHKALNGSLCKNGLADNCSEEESIALRCGFPDATPDGIVRALDADLGEISEDGAVPENKWVYVYKKWKDASQILVSMNGIPIPDAFESNEELTYKNKCYIFYNTPCFHDPRDSKFDGNHDGIQIRIFSDGC